MLLTISDWAVIIGASITAIGTLTLAIATFWSIRANQSARKQDLRDRALDDILNWAENLNLMLDEYPSGRKGPELERLYESLIRIRAQYRIVLRKAQSIMNGKLTPLVDESNSAIQTYLDTILSDEPSSPIATDQFAKLLLSVDRLLKATLELKHKGL